MWYAVLAISAVVVILDVPSAAIPFMDAKLNEWIIWGAILLAGIMGILASTANIEVSESRKELITVLCESAEGQYAGGECVKDGKIIELESGGKNAG